MYRTVRVAHGISLGTTNPFYSVDHCMDIVAMTTNALHQIDQVRRDMYKPVLPSILKGRIIQNNSELFWDNRKERRIEIVACNELAQSLIEKTTTSYKHHPTCNLVDKVTISHSLVAPHDKF